MNQHVLKTWPDSFLAIRHGYKTFEIRSTQDRIFAVNDLLLLREFIPCPTCKGSGRCWDNGDTTDCCADPHGKYTGDEAVVRVTFVAKGVYGLPEELAVLGITPHDIDHHITRDKARMQLAINALAERYLVLQGVVFDASKRQGLENELYQLLDRCKYNFS